MVMIVFLKDTAQYKKDDRVDVKEKDAKDIIEKGYARLSNGVNLKEEWEKHKANNKPVEEDIIIDKEEPQEKKKVSILTLFEDLNPKQTSSAYKLECPDCGLQGGRTEGFILYPKNNLASCHSSSNWFTMLEAYAMKKGIISCLDGRETGQKTGVLEGEQFKETLDNLKEDFDEETYEEILKIANIKKSIQLPNDGKTISTFADELGRTMSKDNLLFHRSETSEIVEIGKIRHSNGQDQYKGFKPVTSKKFVTLMELYFKPWANTYTKNGVISKTKSVSQTIADIVLVSDNFQDKMPVINRIFPIQQPIIYNGELTFPKLGYDERLGSWLSHDAPKICNPDMPLEEATKIINYIFSEFCFQSNEDRTKAIAGALTPFLRGLYSSYNIRTPVMGYRANRERSGKDCLAGITGILIEGIALEEPPISTGDRSSNTNEELRKKYLSALLQGRRRLHFSNNKGYLNSAVFEGIITALSFSDRLLGGNKLVNLDNEMDFSFSGNMGMTLTPDLANRCIFVDLFLDIEDANSRVFKNPDLHKWVLDNRETILSAFYSLVRNWIDKGSPKGSVPFSSFPEWAAICGGIMEAAELGNPCILDKKLSGIATDQETTDMKVLFELGYDKHPNEFLDKKQIKELILEHGDDVFPYIDWDKKPEQTKFGIKLNRFVGRILSDIRLIVENRNIRTTRWKYKFEKIVSTLDEKSTKNEQKDTFSYINPKNDGHLGHLGHLSPAVRLSYKNYNKGKYESTQNVAKVTKVTIPNLKDNTTQNMTNMTKPKSDRNIPFNEAKECEHIKVDCTKQDVIEWIKQNPNQTIKEMYQKLGNGSLEFKNQLLKEGIISENGKGRYSYI